MTDRLMTYPELAEFLGRSEEAARQLAKRRRWRRSISNEDGRARVTVPMEFLDTPRPPVDPRPGEDATDRPTDERPEDDHPDAVTVVTLLQEQIGRLEAELADARTALDVERVRAGQVDVLRSLLDVERTRLEEAKASEAQRVEDLKAERDRWATAAEAGQRQIADLLASQRSFWWPFSRRA